MKYKKYIHYSAEDFIHDDDFMHWVLHPNKETDRFWSGFLQKYPEKREEIKEAAFFIKSVRAVEPSISKQRQLEMYQKVKPETRVRKISRASAKIAALILLLVSIGGALYYFRNAPEKLPFEAFNSDVFEKGRVIMPDGSVSEFSSERTEIHQNATGEITINNDTVTMDKGSASEKSDLAHIIIPYGKRSEVTLADGTKIWLNSGTQFSYPVRFTGNTREVYLSGEAFFDVKSDPSRPFRVITGDLKIEVTGTRFNVSSYESDATTQAVLLSGKISAEKNRRFAHPLELAPGERIVYDKKEDNLEKDQVNVELYASWVNGYLIFENEPIGKVFKKLERYYNKSILTEKLSGRITFSGKLDLAENLEKVLENIAFSASFSVESANDAIVIKPAKKKGLPMN